jgi:hypothetical protein
MVLLHGALLKRTFSLEQSENQQGRLAPSEEGKATEKTEPVPEKNY